MSLSCRDICQVSDREDCEEYAASWGIPNEKGLAVGGRLGDEIFDRLHVFRPMSNP